MIISRFRVLREMYQIERTPAEGSPGSGLPSHTRVRERRDHADGVGRVGSVEYPRRTVAGARA